MKYITTTKLLYYSVEISGIFCGSDFRREINFRDLRYPKTSHFDISKKL